MRSPVFFLILILAIGDKSVKVLFVMDSNYCYLVYLGENVDETDDIDPAFAMYWHYLPILLARAR